MDERLQNDFPIDWEEDHFVSRREFVKFMTVASGGLALGSAGLAAWSRLPQGEIRFEPKKIADASALSPGDSLAFSYPGDRDLCLLLRRQDGTFAAFARRCTHLSCPVEFQPGKDRLYCPCHNGAFSAADGRVLQGPPPHALAQVVLEERDDGIYAIGMRHGAAE